MKRYFFLLILLSTKLLLCFSPVCAANHALLVGVGKYPLINSRYHLEGPAYDVSALKAMLMNLWGFEGENIITLVDGDASKKNILLALDDLNRNTRPGDSIFIFFSGHGTSSYESKSSGLGLDPLTGALVPADFQFGEVADMRRRLIIGERDLKPILMRMDRDRHVLAVFDACYSGYTLRRGVRGRAPFSTKQIPIDWGKGMTVNSSKPDPGTEKAPPYPYKNVIYIAASSMREVAVDINSAHMAGGEKTFDNRPHGALTDALLKGLHGSANTNRDDTITCRELFGFVRSDVSGRFPHTPRLLHPEGNPAIMDQPLFGRTIKRRPEKPPKPGPLRVKLEGANDHLTKMMSNIQGIMETQKNWDILVTRTPTLYSLYLANGYFLADFPVDKPRQMVNRLSRQVKLKELVNFSCPGQSFNVFLDLVGPGGLLIEGEPVGFKVRADKEAHILLMDMDPTGSINVIYPFSREELSPLGAGQELDLSNLSQVVAPFGTETVKVFAFLTRPKALERLVAGKFPPDDERFSLLMNMVRENSDTMAQATIRVKTCAREEIE